MIRLTATVILCCLTLFTSAEGYAAQDTPRNGAQDSAPAGSYPAVVIYTVSWCSHCQEAKKYLSDHGIPYVNRDVEKESAAMQALTDKYQSTGVPLIVIGDDEKVLKGFSPQELEKALSEVRKKRAASPSSIP